MRHPEHTKHVRRALVAGAFATVAASASYALIESEDHLPPLEIARATYPLSLPAAPHDEIPRGQAAGIAQGPGWQTHKVQARETLGTIFAKYGLSAAEMQAVLESNEIARELRALAPGHVLKFRTRANGQLKDLIYQQSAAEAIEVHRDAKGFTASKSAKHVDRELTRASATIHSSLFDDGKRAGLTDKLIIDLANIFGWDIDFALDLREGDSFTVIYETIYVDGEQVGTSDILAAEFINQGKTYQALRFSDEHGRADYYTANGQGVHKAFLRTPVEFTRISSYFSLARKHPVLNTIRAHKGVDYAAPTGTPVRSTGNGRIAFVGTQNGYGNVVIVEHGQSYSTLYGHLSRFHAGLKKGSTVRQGDIIGYVGQTGLATGPHLHYEFRVGGVHQDPLTVALPQAEPLRAKQLAAFRQRTQQLVAELSRFRDVAVAQLD